MRKKAIYWAVSTLTLFGRRETMRALGGAVAGLGELHSGLIGDYVTWLTIGVAALGALSAALLRN